MASVNKVFVLGNLARDPEVRYTPSGAAVCTVGVATNRTWKDKFGEKQEEVEFHRVVFYDRLAEIAGEYLAKGEPCYVEGRLKTRKWQDKDGKDVYTTEIIAESLQLLGQRREKNGNAERGAQTSRKPAQEPARGNASAGRTAPPARRPAASTGTGFDDMDDDIPF